MFSSARMAISPLCASRASISASSATAWVSVIARGGRTVSEILPFAPTSTRLPTSTPTFLAAAVPASVIFASVSAGMSSGVRSSVLVMRPFSFTVTLVKVPAFAPVFTKIAVMVASAEPSKVVTPVTSPAREMALAVLSFCATIDSATTTISSAVTSLFHTAEVSEVAIRTCAVFSLWLIQSSPTS